jgi:CDP-diacylglycerol--glycerol-3-phosphate 3-phosphatidyltransferase
MILLAYGHAANAVFIACLVLAFLSDVLDGLLARWLGVTTPALRRYDSLADIGFYLAVLWCVVVLHPQAVAEYGAWLLALVAAEMMCQILSVWRFGSTTATHAWLCKLWSVLLCLSSVVLLGLGVAGGLLRLTLFVGGLAYFDVLLILALAPAAPVDVPSCWHAWKWRERVQRARMAGRGTST